MIKNIKKYALLITIFTFTFSVVAQARTLDGGEVSKPPVSNGGNNNSTNNGNGKPPTTSNTVIHNYLDGVASWIIYDEAYHYFKTNDIKFVRVSENARTEQYINAEGQTVKMHYPYVDLVKTMQEKDREISRTTDYYTWTCAGAESWTERGGRYRTVTFNQVGEYTVTSVPNQTVKREKWVERYIQVKNTYVDGKVKIMHQETTVSPKTTYTKNYDRTDLKRVWKFKITPEEVGKPIPLDPTNPSIIGPEELNPDDVDIEVVLIQ